MTKILPKNKAKEKDITPTVFFIWGQSMSGKTYLARQFPDPIILNTDGNAKKVTTPSVEVYDFPTFMGAIKELEAGDHDFQTIIIDLVDDIRVMLEMYILEKYDVDDIGDIPWGRGYKELNSTWQRLMVRLSQMPYNIIYISHILNATDDSGEPIEVPSLDQKFYNMTMGRSDMSIKCRKVGNNYSQIVVSKRDQYTKEDFKDEAVLEVLKNAINLFPREGVSTMKPKGKVATGSPKPLKKAKDFKGRVDEVLEEVHEVNEKNDAEEVENETPKKIIPNKKAKAEDIEPETTADAEPQLVEEVVEEKPKKKAPARKTAPKKEVSGATGYYFNPETATYLTLSGEEKPTEDLIPIPKAVYDTAVAGQEDKTEDVEELEPKEVDEKPKKAVKRSAPKKLKPMAGKKV